MKHLLSPKLALIAVLGMIAISPVSAVTPFDLSATQVGGFFADGSVDNDVTFQNYYVGYSMSTSLAERRNFFVFDLTTVTTPVASADFSLILPFGGLIFGGGDLLEDFLLSGTTFPSTTILDTLIDPASAMMVFDTFGDPFGAPVGLIGGTTFDSAMPPIVPTMGLEIVIPLDPTGIDLINANLGGELIITGRMADVTPLDPMGEASELIWGLTDVVASGTPTGLTVPFLSITSVPEPGRAVLAFCGFVLCMASRRRRLS